MYWDVVFLKDGRATGCVSLTNAVTTIGRDPANTLQLADASVSRFHAELRNCPEEGLVVEDVKSRNGLKVNGVPRRKAILQAGDIVEVGIYRFEIRPGSQRSGGVVSRPEPGEQLRDLEKTELRSMQLPKPRQERMLAMLTHICFWLLEDLGQEPMVERFLQVLLQGFDAAEVHLYSGALELEAFSLEQGGKPKIRVAPFLAEKCQNLPEASIISGDELRKHQQKVGAFQYLVAPLPVLGEEKGRAPFLLVARPAEWVRFTGEEKALLQVISQLWVRGRSKGQMVKELKRENVAFKQRIAGRMHLLLGESEQVVRLRERLQKIAGTNATVLVQGETGSGKELVARTLHEHGTRVSGPFVKVDCAAMPEGLIESELFGHVKGAFTDARAHHEGKFARADGGTLFLDEIGEMQLSVQAKLLLAIESGEIEPVGGEKVRKVDVRIVAATHRDLDKMVAEGRFRQDLLYRLKVIQVRVPPLREHPRDIAIIARHFLADFCAANGLADLELAPGAVEVLAAHSWPGNVRELRNVVQRCAVESGGLLVQAADVRQALFG